ncbi:Putative (R)-citramalate synthase CimA (fragment) [uncultured Desulfobacterium sp.]|uniref:(R)-citramalate synthase CimA n=1 Tax=uncultured Desulfobacterium sp. TaxID=201089 RepID=A0A445MUX5_9BACT
MNEIRIVDGTLREGEQTPGVIFTRDEKLAIAHELDLTGVRLLDVGMPAVSADEREAISAIAGEGLKASIGVSVRMRREEIEQAAHCKANEIFLICPVSYLHIAERLGIDEKGLTGLAKDMVNCAADKGLAVNIAAEDATRADISFVIDFICISHELGAKSAFICDTVGISEPFAMKTCMAQVKEAVPADMELGVHCHNDLGLATANTLAAVDAGANLLSVTVNGIGERAGNAPLHEVAVAVEKIFHRSPGLDMHSLYRLSRLVERCSGIFISPHTPIVGLNAFRHESGIHVDGILKNSKTYTGLDPDTVNRLPAFVLGKHTGTQTIRHLLMHRGYEASEEDLAKILCLVKQRKIAGVKKEIHRMSKDMEAFYDQCLTFPMDTFWKIVEEVLG